MDYYEHHGGNARLTCRHFDLSPQTFYRWRRRYNCRDLSTLETRSQRPRRLRQPTWSAALERAVLEPRDYLPRALAQAQRRGRTRPAHPYRGVL